ncbi:MAG: hypothetical protein ACRDAW_00580, partial [Metamycoplasmataceae bacterium]
EKSKLPIWNTLNIAAKLSNKMQRKRKSWHNSFNIKKVSWPFYIINTKNKKIPDEVCWNHQGAVI